jgi:hypothetical protein
MSRIAVGPSERNFGLTFAALFTAIALWPWVFRGLTIRPWALVLAGLFALAALVAPRILAPLNRAWLRLGIIMHHVGNPVAMGLIYFLGFVPMGLVMRASGKDFLRLRWQPDASSYWVRRQPPGPSPSSMSKQF